MLFLNNNQDKDKHHIRYKSWKKFSEHKKKKFSFLLFQPKHSKGCICSQNFLKCIPWLAIFREFKTEYLFCFWWGCCSFSYNYFPLASIFNQVGLNQSFHNLVCFLVSHVEASWGIYKLFWKGINLKAPPIDMNWQWKPRISWPFFQKITYK